MHRNPRVKSIAPGAPFLPTLVDALLSGRLLDNYAPGDDPLALSAATIWVPTKRAARELATEFVQRLSCDVALLPTIRTLGDVDDDDLFFDGDNTDTLDLEEPVSGLHRQLKLASLIEVWGKSLNQSQRALFSDADILMPSSTADAVWFAQDLARLMDTVATEEADWSALEELVPDDHAEWWRLTLQFLKIATEFWPAHLAEIGKIDSTVLRAKRLRSQADIYASSDNEGPVIAAGSTGSIPATATLLKTIAHMKTGVVVLPGLDRTMNEEVWTKIDLPDNDRDDFGSAPGHPQYGLKLLLDAIGLNRADVEQLSGVDDTGIAFTRIREQLVSTALLPSDATSLWNEKPFKTDQQVQAFSNISLIEAQSEREEALAIALALREKLEEPESNAALVTPDRNLARRVAVELRRFGLEVDDSAGQPLRNRPHGSFVRLALKVAFGVPDSVALVSLLKHPLSRFGMDSTTAHTAAQLFELALLRGTISPPSNGRMKEAVRHRQTEVAELGYVHASLAAFKKTDWEIVQALAEKLDHIFADAADMSGFRQLATKTIQVVEALAIDETGNLKGLYQDEDGQAFSSFFNELIDQGDPLSVSATQWPDVFEGLLGDRVVRPHGGAHSRLSILGPLEARLQTFDRVVLAGLNEKTWPASARNDPFLSRPMKAQMKLPPPERRTGLAAHDFQMMLGMEDVFITRSARADNAPTIASRWLQRVLMVAGEEAAEAMRNRGQRVLDWVAQIDQPQIAIAPVSQPRPQPPIEMRPQRLSITDIETWVKDPYVIYARRILGLAALEPLQRNADARERGNLYHGVFEEFIRDHHELRGNSALAALTKIADRQFEESAVPDETAVLWRPRLQTIIANFVRWHDDHFDGVENSWVELKGEQKLETGSFVLSGRADRIDVLKDGSLALLDYKTGTNPTIADVKKLNAPQLPLEAAMAARGAFKELSQARVSSLAYVRLRPDDVLAVDSTDAGKRPVDAAELAEDAWQKLTGMVEAYRDPQMPYVSKARLIKDSDWPSDYDHLARVREWSLADDGDGDSP